MRIDMDQIYKFHQGARGHSIQVCPTFREHIQCLLDSFQQEILEGAKTNEIKMLDVKPITIVYGKKTPIGKESISKAVQDDVLVIKVPGPFKYGDDQRPHRQALVRVLKQAYVAYNVLVANFSHLAGNILALNHISFNDDEIPPDGRGSIKALHISIKCKAYFVARVLMTMGYRSTFCLCQNCPNYSWTPRTWH
ncbi:hypothetical protein GOBAR_DD20416 [Gossypium barbadense]|nr:hypothetical protein GOBAR_DD20416 [Gossypium barbadense]